MRGDDPVRVVAPKPRQDKRREAKAALLKTMMKRQRLRLIIGHGGTAMSRVNDALRNAVRREHAWQAGHTLGAGPRVEGPGRGRSGGRGSSRGRSSQSVAPSGKRGSLHKDARSASPSRGSPLLAPVEIKAAKGAAVVIGADPALLQAMRKY